MMQTLWKGPDVELPELMTWPELAGARAAKEPDGVILVDAATGRSLTAAELKSAWRKAARGLAALGFGPGDCLCTLTGNDLSWYVAALAAQSLGGTISGINPMATQGEIVRQFACVPAKSVLVHTSLVAVGRSISEELGIPIVLATASGSGLDSIWDIDGPHLEDPVNCAPDDPALLPFSSGSTGLPKAAIVTHGNLVAGGVQIRRALRFAANDRFLGLAPLFHIVGPSIFSAVLAKGGSIAVVPKLDLPLIFEAIEHHGVTHLPLLTPVLRALARHPAGEERDYARLKFVGAGGSAMSPADHVTATKRFGCPVVQVYGMTETSSAIAVDDMAAPSPETVGRLVALMQMRIADADGRALPQGSEGEIQLSGPNIFKGYLDRPEETVEIFTGDGFMRTGDLGKVRSDGRIVITGRIKEMIKVNAGQVAPAELELLLSGHPDVVEAAVTGRPNRYCGEAPVAWLVLTPGANPYAVIDWLNDQLIAYKRVRAVEVVEALPRNATGKIDRKALASMDLAATDPAVTERAA